MTRWLKLVAGLLVGAIAWGGAGLAQAVEAGRTIFVSTTAANDRHDGLSPQSPWRSLGRVSAADLKAGDRVLFRRGEAWRGTLVPRSGREGAPITYVRFGNGIEFWAGAHDNLVEACRIWEGRRNGDGRIY
jgi:hypothetical protein